MAGARWVVIALISLLYYAAPNVKQPRFRWVSRAGSSPSWSGSSRRRPSASTSPTSAPTTRPTARLGGVIVFLIWLWITNLALLFGAELNAELERGRQLAEDPPAEREIQLEPRADRKEQRTT